MAASIIAVIREEVRQSHTGDDKYHKKGNHVFVLNGPAGEGPLDPFRGVAQFPLVINPETFEYRMPFAAEITPLQEGGIVAEEQGVVVAELRLGGTTGFKLRDNLGEVSSGRGDGEFTGGVDDGAYLMTSTGSVLGGISGHMHLWRLASRCFDGYSALKKDPKNAHRTTMEYHSVKDDLHVQVVPREFAIERNASKERVTYRYNIRAAVVGPASTTIHIPSPDIGLLQSFKNTISKIRNAIQGITAAINDVTASIDEIRRSIIGVAGILSDMTSIVEAFKDLVDGVKKFVDIPKTFLTAMSNLDESAASRAAATASFPPDVAQSFRDMADGTDRLSVAVRNYLKEKMSESARNYERLTEGHREGKDPKRDNAASDLKSEADDGQGRLSVDKVFGGAVKPGDVARGRKDQISSRVRLKPGEFHGFEERVIGDGDTLQSLAAKHLGDARQWLAIALANQLQAPYITDGAKMPGTLQVGSRVIIPLRQAVGDPDTLTAGEPTLGDSQADQFMGRDFELQPLGNGTFDWAIDTAAGSTDVRRVVGVPNLEQAIGARFATEQGQNILYPSIGLPRLVGSDGRTDSLINIRHESRRQILADPRIKRMKSFKFKVDGDKVELEASVVPIGFTNERVISRMLS